MIVDFGSLRPEPGGCVRRHGLLACFWRFNGRRGSEGAACGSAMYVPVHTRGPGEERGGGR
eukprot:750959-Pleurochrysis_carterae.AAC.2